MIDEDLELVDGLLRTGDYYRVRYSATSEGGLGTGTFVVGEAVKRYIVDGLRRVCAQGTCEWTRIPEEPPRMASAAVPLPPLPVTSEGKAVRFCLHDVRPGEPLPPVCGTALRPPGSPPCAVKVVVEAGGITTTGYQLWRQYPHWRIGTMVAGNSGKPGGACGGYKTSQVAGAKSPSFEGSVSHRKLHENHRTQEEDVVSNWLLTSSSNSNHTSGVDIERHASQVYDARLFGAWGLRDFTSGNSTTTIQEVDYSAAVPHLYGDAWVVDDVRLSRKCVDPNSFDFKDQYLTSLFFVAAPNVNDRTTGHVSTRATVNHRIKADYALFRQGVKAALRAGLLAMADRKCDAALLAGAGTGLYAGPFRGRIQADFETLVNELLNEPMQHAGRDNRPACLGDCFHTVVWTKLS